VACGFGISLYGSVETAPGFGLLLGDRRDR
jgi:hypothetical protein